MTYCGSLGCENEPGHGLWGRLCATHAEQLRPIRLKDQGRDLLADALAIARAVTEQGSLSQKGVALVLPDSPILARRDAQAVALYRGWVRASGSGLVPGLTPPPSPETTEDVVLEVVRTVAAEIDAQDQAADIVAGQREARTEKVKAYAKRRAQEQHERDAREADQLVAYLVKVQRPVARREAVQNLGLTAERVTRAAATATEDGRLVKVGKRYGLAHPQGLRPELHEADAAYRAAVDRQAA